MSLTWQRKDRGNKNKIIGVRGKFLLAIFSYPIIHILFFCTAVFEWSIFYINNFLHFNFCLNSCFLANAFDGIFKIVAYQMVVFVTLLLLFKTNLKLKISVEIVGNTLIIDKFLYYHSRYVGNNLWHWVNLEGISLFQRSQMYQTRSSDQSPHARPSNHNKWKWKDEV